jgi:hypothetical protein
MFTTAGALRSTSSVKSGGVAGCAALIPQIASAHTNNKLPLVIFLDSCLKLARLRRAVEI